MICPIAEYAFHFFLKIEKYLLSICSGGGSSAGVIERGVAVAVCGIGCICASDKGRRLVLACNGGNVDGTASDPYERIWHH